MLPQVQRLAVALLHQPGGGWKAPAFLELGSDGRIAAIHDREPETWRGQPVLRSPGAAIPGLANLHSHAFQRALSGRTEANPDGREDSFFTWRTLMYGLAARITPEALEAIAGLLYAEMLEAGMTSVGEFHYLHHDANGAPYADPLTLHRPILAAAERTGIGLCHLPVYYERGGFQRAPEPSQARFVHRDVERFLALLQALAAPVAQSGGVLGVAPHSLRAVSPESLAALVAGVQQLQPNGPIHMHVAEQEREVAEAQQHLSRPPIAWLLEHMPIDARWCFVHATWASEPEIVGLAKSGAVAGLCPTTEANLGDGIFPARAFLQAGGAFGVGSDSHVSVDGAEELRLLEYGQRLLHRRRNLLADPALAGGSVGRRLYDQAVLGGVAALGRGPRALLPGAPADLVILDLRHPRLLGQGPKELLDAYVFGAGKAGISDVIAAGRHVVSEGRHREKEALVQAYARTIPSLLA